MHEPDIAPLARRLAEENNVDWRRLHGSGEGGRVVERDVLGYLARVMAGDEAVDPTPEPVPEGMEAWPEADVQAHASGRDRAHEGDSPPTLDDELFLFEDPAPVPSDAAPVETASVGMDLVADDAEPATVVDAEEQEDDLWLVGDEPQPGPAVEPAAPDAADAVEPAGEAEGNGRDDVRLDELPDLTAMDAADERDSEAAERGFTPGGREAFDLPDLFGAEADAPAAEGEALDDEPLFERAGEALEPAKDAPLEGADEPPDVWSPTAVAAPPDSEAQESAPSDTEVQEPVRPDAEAPDPEAPQAEAQGLAALDTEVPEPHGSEAALTAAAWPQAPVPDPIVGGVWARYGQVWRRRIDDRTLRRSVSDLASALDAPPSSVVALLLARAARRGGAAAGAVEVWRWRRGGAERVAVDVEAPLREAVHRLETGHGATEGDRQPSLVVADLSALDLDEAVLHLDVPVLALGRSSGDGAWLSLSGEEVDGALVGTLAVVAELLAAPVRLLV